MTESSTRVFDDFDREYSFWIEHINPPHYHDLLDAFLPEEIILALHAGCGSGHLARYLAGRANQVIAVDLSRDLQPFITGMHVRGSWLGYDGVLGSAA